MPESDKPEDRLFINRLSTFELEIYKRGMLTCPWCGEVAPDRVAHKYHLHLYCPEAQRACHTGD